MSESIKKPETVTQELVAQMKFLREHLRQAEQAVIERRGALFMLQQYIAQVYGLNDGDQITETGEILRLSS